MHVLSHDGGLVDAACIGVIAALQHFRKPDTSTEGENVVVYTLAEREPVPLSILHHPYCVTFSIYSSGDGDEEVTLLDTTLLEEQLREGAATIGINRHGEVCQIAKLGGLSVDAVMLLNCVQVALVKVKEISAFVGRMLEEDGRRRDKGGVIAELLSAENERVS